MESSVVQEPQKSPDRRKSLRIPLVVLRVTEQTDRSTLFGYAKQISRSGLFISSVSPRAPGERFWISFQLPNSTLAVKCECEVVWNRQFKKKSKLEPGYGVKFLDLPDSVSDAIEEWMAAHE